MYTEESVNEVKEAARIAEVVGDFVTLKKLGPNLAGLCPFHEEKTPSFKVSESKNLFKCFGCSKSGDPVQFLMEHRHMKYVEALEWLATKYNISLIKTEDHVYIKPTWKNQTTLSEKVVRWFEKRSISQKTIQQLRITDGPEWMHKAAAVVHTIQFNYFRSGELINIKYRDKTKDFKLNKRSELILYNLDSVIGKKEIYWVEGECFHPSAQVLTPRGWIALEDYKDEIVAQYLPNGTVEFVQPLAKIKKHFFGDLIQLSNQQKYFSLTTPDHNLVVKKKNGVISKIKAKDVSEQFHIPRVAKHNGDGIRLSDDQIRLCIAVSADFSIRESGDVYGAVKKERKKIRMCGILDRLNIPYSCRKDKRNFWSIFICRGNVPNYLFKLFPHSWVFKSSLEQKKLIIDEMLFWDRNSVPRRQQTEYSSKEIHNAVFMQTVSSLVGYCSTIIPRSNHLGSWFKVSFLFTKTTTACQGLRKNRVLIPYDGDVYCVTVPSGMLMIRQNNCISVSGNCDAASLVEAGYVNETSGVVSVPNGASLPGKDGLSHNNLTYINNCIEQLSHIEKHHIALDDDIPGRLLREDIAVRFGKDKCDYITWGDKKDANEVLMADGIQGVIDCCSKPNNFPVEGTFTVSDVSKKIDDLYYNGLDKGVDPRIPDFELNIVLGYFTIITGIPSHGKTTFLDYMILNLLRFSNWSGAFYAPESMPMELHFSEMASQLIGKPWEGENRMTFEQVQLVKGYLDKKLWFIEPEEDFTLASILKSVKALIKAYGIKFFVIDAWNKLEHKQEPRENETAYISRALDMIATFCKLNKVHCFLIAHPTKIDKEFKTDKYKVPTLYNISGSAHFYNKCFNGISVYRDFETGETFVYRQKVKLKHWGRVGYSKYKFHIPSNRYYKEGYPDMKNWITGETNITQAKEDNVAPQLASNTDEPPF